MSWERALSCVVLLLTVTREWPWGLVVFGDPTDTEALPTTLNDAGIAAGARTVVSRVLHAIDGPATAEVTVDEPEPVDLHQVHRGRVHSNGELRLGDAAGERTEDCAIDPGDYVVGVYVDDEQHPTRVRFALTAGQS